MIETGVTFEQFDERLRESLKKRPPAQGAGTN